MFLVKMTEPIEPDELKSKARELLEILCTGFGFSHTVYRYHDSPLDMDEIQNIIEMVYAIYLGSNKNFLPMAIDKLDEAMRKILIPTEINGLSMVGLAQNIQEICSEFLEENAEWIRQRCLGILQDKRKGFRDID